MRPTSPARALAVLATVLLAVTGCSPIGATASPPPTPAATSTALWPAPSNPLELAVATGLHPDVQEHLANHSHAHLDVFVDGVPVVVPSGIGINTQDPEVERFELPNGSVGYGGIQVCGAPCISPLHTHDETGILHTEAATSELNTLGQFFDEWDVALSASCVGELCGPKPIAFYVDGVAYTGDPRAIELADRREIAIVIGTPPATIPATADFSQA